VEDPITFGGILFTLHAHPCTSIPPRSSLIGWMRPPLQGVSGDAGNTTPAHPWWISETASDQRPWMVLFHRGGKPDHFILSRFLIGRLRMEIMDAKVLPKIRKFRWAPEFLADAWIFTIPPEFLDFLAWRTRQTGTVCVRPYKPAQVPHWNSATASRRVNTFRRRTPAGTERSQLLWTLPRKTVRRCFWI
jgi:hypothetical protein